MSAASDADASAGENGRKGDEPDPQEERVSLLDVFVALSRRKALIIRTTVAFVLLGVTYSLLVSEEYTSEVKVARESQSETPDLGSVGGLGALQGLGVNLGGAGSGLSVSAFPNVLKSREVRLSVVRDTFQFPGANQPRTYIEHVNQPPGVGALVLKYTLRLPWTIVGALLPDGPTSQSGATDTTRVDVPSLPSKEVDRALKSLKGKVSVSVNDESGLMSISVTASGSRLSADLVESFTNHLTNRVREIRTEKIRERLNFIEQRFREAERELETAEDQLAQFLERNQNPTTATLRFRRDRLQRQVTFKEQLYSEIQSQLTQTRLELQRRQPVLTVVEKAVPPLKRSWPSRTLIVLVSLFFGLALGIGIALVQALVNLRVREEERRKVQEITNQIVPDSVRKWWKEQTELT
ncbi:Wzz/FepE/Etk N-terminal domain-containing protein [Salinibacter sp.]|uniref:Wzz/FepE/Etk N-terminal domain-containing protein n=1 Tax=Salinibacter sp. TaxID=2065818 RepID=UPI0021E7CC2E|nr:Wzz/FepE/Etk N-terminal domain-containing protein [Salinibacter sp.]